MIRGCHNPCDNPNSLLQPPGACNNPLFRPAAVIRPLSGCDKGGCPPQPRFYLSYFPPALSRSHLLLDLTWTCDFQSRRCTFDDGTLGRDDDAYGRAAAPDKHKDGKKQRRLQVGRQENGAGVVPTPQDADARWYLQLDAGGRCCHCERGALGAGEPADAGGAQAAHKKIRCALRRMAKPLPPRD